MERRASAKVIALVFACLSLMFHPASAQDADPAGTGEYPVGLRAGEAFDLCSSGQVLCPAHAAICDDPKVALPVDLPGGLGFMGVSPGTTLCSAASAAGPRRVFRITVR